MSVVLRCVNTWIADRFVVEAWRRIPQTALFVICVASGMFGKYVLPPAVIDGKELRTCSTLIPDSGAAGGWKGSATWSSAVAGALVATLSRP